MPPHVVEIGIKLRPEPIWERCDIQAQPGEFRWQTRSLDWRTCAQPKQDEATAIGD